MLFAWAAIAVASIPGLAQIEIETSVDSVLDKRSDAWGVYQSSQTEFGGDETIVAMVSSWIPWDEQLLRRISKISAELEEHEGVRRVDSLTTLPAVRVSTDGTVVLSPAAGAKGDRPSSAVRKIVTADNLARGHIVSADGYSYAINIVLDQGAYSNASEILDRLHDLTDDLSPRVSGVPVFRVQTNLRTQRELLSLAPLSAAVLLVLLVGGIGFRWLAAVPLAVGAIAAVVALGVMGFLGVPFTVSTLILPPVLLGLGAAYSMHVVHATLQSPQPARGEAYAAIALPILLSGLTTTIGFIAMTTVSIEAIRLVATFGALGATVATVAALTMAPALLYGAEGATTIAITLVESRLVAFIQNAASRHGRVIVGAFFLAAVATGLGVGRLNVDTDVIRWFPVDDPVRGDYRAIRDSLSGITPINVILSTSDGDFLDRDKLEALSEFAEFARSRADIGKVISLADPLCQIHSGFSGEPGCPLPPSRELTEQYLLLLESMEHLPDLIGGDRSRTNVILRLNVNGSRAILDVERGIREWWSHRDPKIEATVTGIMYEFARAEHEIAWGQLRGLAIAIVVIGGILFVALRSVRSALIGLIPNALPLVACFGLMGWMGVPLDAGTVLVGTLALGIGVDDTVHLLTTFGSLRDASHAPEDALRRSLGVVLVPLLITTLLLVGMFSVLALSGFAFIKGLGLVSASVLVVCLAADLLLLPAILLMGRR